MAGRGSVTQVTDSRELVRAGTGRAIEENNRKWFSSQALSVACDSKRTRGVAMDGHGPEERGSRNACRAPRPSTSALRAYAQGER